MNWLRRRFILIAAGCVVALALFSAPPAGAGGPKKILPVSRFAEMDGHKLHYWSLGQGAKALVLIHGWACDASFWQGQLCALTSGSYQVIALDLLGHGLSDKPRVEYGFDTFAKGIRAVLTHAGVKEAVLCGHSLGGSLCRYLALHDPAGITGLIMVDGALAFPPQDPGRLKKWLDERKAFAGQFKKRGYRKTAQSFIFAMLGPAITPGLTVRIVEGMLKTPSRVAINAMRHFTDMANWDGGPLKLPVLAAYVRSPHLTEQFRKKLRASFVDLDYHEFPGLGHFFMMEKPDKLNILVKGFLQKRKLLGR